MKKYYIGLDGGSTYLKAALIGGGRVIDTMVRNTGIDNDGTARKIAKELCDRNSLMPSDIGYIMATGYSRKVLEVADDDISEITAHAYGVRLTAPKEYRPGMIIDIGGQDSKIIYLDQNYGVKNFSMNDKCAAGTGKFMEVIAQILETTIDYEFIAVIALCCIASLAGRNIIDETGCIFGIKTALIVDNVGNCKLINFSAETCHSEYSEEIF